MTFRKPVIADSTTHKPLPASDQLFGNSIQLSTDFGNSITLGSDGGLMATGGGSNIAFKTVGTIAITDFSPTFVTPISKDTSAPQQIPLNVSFTVDGYLEDAHFDVLISGSDMDGNVGKVVPDALVRCNTGQMGMRPNSQTTTFRVSGYDPTGSRVSVGGISPKDIPFSLAMYLDIPTGTDLSAIDKITLYIGLNGYTKVYNVDGTGSPDVYLRDEYRGTEFGGFIELMVV